MLLFINFWFIDRNECVDGLYGCDKNMIRVMCMDLVGSYKCFCNKGWEGNGFFNCRGN